MPASAAAPLLLSLALSQAPAPPAAAPPPPPASPPQVEVKGEVRARGELLRELDLNPAVRTTAAPNALDGEQVLLRTRVGVLLRATPWLRLYGQLQDARAFGEEATPTTLLGNVDLHQGYLELGDPDALPVTLKVGRFELAYGDSRLVGAGAWGHPSRAFDGAVLRVTPVKGLSVDGFWTRLHADPRASSTRSYGDDFAGVYATWGGLPLGLTLDAYTLALYDRGGAAADGTARLPGGGDSLLFTPGVRADLKPVSGLHLNAEAALQRGTRGALDVAAWAVHAAADYTFASVPLAPRLLVGYDGASGDADPGDTTWGTFENLFPTNHNAYGMADLASWRNLSDVWGGVGVEPLAGLTAQAALHWLARAESADTFYRDNTQPLFPRATAAAVTDDDVGTELDLLVAWQAGKNLNVQLGWAHVWGGAFLDAAAGRPVDPTYAWLQLTGSF